MNTMRNATYDVGGNIISRDLAVRRRNEAVRANLESATQFATDDPPPLLPEGAIYGPLQRVLVSRNQGLGDVLCVTPLVRFLHSKGITVDVKTEFPTVFENNPYVSKVMPMDLHIDTADYDAVIDLNGYVERPENVTQHRPSAFAKSIHVDLRGDYRLNWFVSNTERMWAARTLSDIPYMSKPIGYCYNTSTANRNWSHETHLQVITELVRAKYSVIVFCANKVAIEVDSFRLFNATGKYNLRQTGAMLNQCKAVVTPDTGIFHLASALQKPILAYFGSFPLEERATTDDVTLINHPGNCPFTPCRSYQCHVSEGQSPCLDVNMDRVLKTLEGGLQ